MSVIPTGDGTCTLLSTEYGQTYRSTFGALTEACHVFLKGAQVTRILAARRAIRVLEVGFGAGLNFLITAAESRSAGASLSYTALEKTLPAATHLELLGYGDIDGLQDPAAALAHWRQELPPVVPRGRYEQELLPGCRLTLLIGDATEQVLPLDRYDVVYLDGFSPKVNSELWAPTFVQSLFNALVPGGMLATYSSAGQVRRTLLCSGFRVMRRVGPTGKREVLAAEKPATYPTTSTHPSEVTSICCPVLSRAKSSGVKATTGRIRS